MNKILCNVSIIADNTCTVHRVKGIVIKSTESIGIFFVRGNVQSVWWGVEGRGRRKSHEGIQ